MSTPFDPRTLRALAFDVFGTVVDWRSSVAAEVRALGWPVEPAAFADAWRAGYVPAMQAVRDGRLPWMHIDALHRRILDALLAERGLAPPEAEVAELNRVWHRLAPWPDSVAGLQRLKAQFPVCTLSNGNVSLLLDMARHAGLPWDTIFSAELFGHYKPDPEVYLGAARYVPRPLERGPGGAMEPWKPGEFDLVAEDFMALAAALGA